MSYKEILQTRTSATDSFLIYIPTLFSKVTQQTLTEDLVTTPTLAPVLPLAKTSALATVLVVLTQLGCAPLSHKTSFSFLFTDHTFIFTL
jgi:hypothetical protein